MALNNDTRQFGTFEAAYDYDLAYTEHKCASDSDPSLSPSEDSDFTSSAPPRRFRASQKNSRSRNNKMRTLNRWTTEEHDKLAYLVEKWGSEKNWAKVAEEMPGRTGKQCRERWLNHMKPGIIKGNWSPEEEFLLAQCHALVGSHWSKMTKRLPGRTENSIKNFWNATLRSKAPNKKRGMLWTYMQLHDPRSEDNTAALINTVNRLHETRELPPHLLAQLDAQMLDSRTWKTIHKAEKEFLENNGGELHYLALPHPALARMASAASLQCYGSAAAAGLPAMSCSMPLESLDHANMPASSRDQAAYLLQQQPDGARLDPAMSMAYPDGMLTGMPGAVVADGAAAMGVEQYNAVNLLTAQHPLLRCGPDTLDQDLLKAFSTEDDHHHQQPQPATLDASGTAQEGDSSAASAADAAPAVGQGSMEPPASYKLPRSSSKASSGDTAEPGGAWEDPGQQQQQQQIGNRYSKVLDLSARPPSNMGSAGDSAQHAEGTAQYSYDLGAQAPHQIHLPQSSEPLCSLGGGIMLDAVSRQDQQVAAAGAAAAAYGGSAAMGLHVQQQGAMSSPAYIDATNDLQDSYITVHGSHFSTGSRPAGGHGPLCSCGPCSNSRRLHGLHSPAARRGARNNTSRGAAQYQQMAPSMTQANPAGNCPYQQMGSQLQQQIVNAKAATAAAVGYLDVSSHHVDHQQHQQQQLKYASESHSSSKFQLEGYSACQPAAAEHLESNTGMANAAPSAETFNQCVKTEPACEPQQASTSWTAAHSGASTDTMHTMQGALCSTAQQAETVAAGTAAELAPACETACGLPWQSSRQPEQQLLQQQSQPVQQVSNMPPHPPAHAATAAGNYAGQTGGGRLNVPHLTVPAGQGPDALASLLLSPLGLGLLSPLSGLMMPASARPFRLPSFGQITFMRPSINGGEWDWDSLLGSTDITHNAQRNGANGGANGDSAAGGAESAAVRAGTKRPRCSVTNIEEEAALLIDMQPAKSARGAEISPAAALCGLDNGFLRDFLSRFE